MMRVNDIIANKVSAAIQRLGPAWLPFADAATVELPMSRLLRLSLFQISVGMAAVLLVGTLNRVMIVELNVPASLVGLMIALPLLFAPLRAFIGYRSDVHVSLLGWRRVPYIWAGAMLQYGGLAIMPFALLVLSGDTTHNSTIIGPVAAGIAFLLTGAGLHTTQTVGLALANDLAPPHARPKVVALLCAMLLVGMVISSLLFGLLLREFSNVRLIQVIQGAAIATLVLNIVALWKQEARQPLLTAPDRKRATLPEMWAEFSKTPNARRRLVALALGTASFSMQDVLLEPFGGQVLGLSVALTTALTAVFAAGGIAGLAVAARRLGLGADPYRVAGSGAVVGLAAFGCVTFSAPIQSALLFAFGALLIGYGSGLFAHATLTAAMQSAAEDQSGFALGVWGAVQASAAGLAIASGAIIRDGVDWLAMQGAFGPALATPAFGFSFVYHIEIALLFATLAAIGPLVGAEERLRRLQNVPSSRA